MTTSDRWGSLFVITMETDHSLDGIIALTPDTLTVEADSQITTYSAAIRLDAIAPAFGPQAAAGRSINGTRYNDVLNGTADDDTINAGAGNDRLVGKEGDDVLNGEAGNDTLRGGPGYDTLDGGSGFDWADYSDITIPGGILVDLNSADPQYEGDTLKNIEGVIGTSSHDQLIGLNEIASKLNGAAGDDKLIGGNKADLLLGGAGDDTLAGGLGADTLNGGEGLDLADYSGSSEGVSITFASRSDNWGEPAIGDVLIGVEGLILTAYRDDAYGNAAANLIKGGGEEDYLWGGGGSDTLNGGTGPDHLLGQEGSDWASYEDAGDGVTASLLDSKINTGEAQGDVYASIENLIGSFLNDTLHGDDGANIIAGGYGDDSLFGHGGSDTFVGGPGADTMDGGDGFDWVNYRTAGIGVIVDLSKGNVEFSGGKEVDLLSGIEGIIGSRFDDFIVGDAADNNFVGGSGNDTFLGGEGRDRLDGGDGFDVAFYGDVLGTIFVSLASPGQNTGVAAGDTYVSIEGLVLGNGNDTASGNAGDNYLFGGWGNDTLNGLDGNDTLEGSGGGEVLNGGSGSDWASYASAGSPFDGGIVVSLADPAANTGDAVGDTYVSIENLLGSRYDDTLTGSIGNNTIEGGEGADRLDGGKGINTLSYQHSVSGVMIDLVSGTGSGGDAEGDTFTNFQNVIGSARGDIIASGSGANRIDGGDGSDVVSYEASTTGIRVDLNLTTAQSSGGYARGDVLTRIEIVEGSGFADWIKGNAVANNLSGGGGNDTLDGGAGNDKLYGDAGDDRLSGGAGNDKLYSGDGADTLTGGSGNDEFAINGFDGKPKVITDFTHGADLILLGMSAFPEVLVGSFEEIFVNGTSATDDKSRLIYDKATGSLYYDADGVGGQEQVKFAVLTNKAVLTASDFWIV